MIVDDIGDDQIASERIGNRRELEVARPYEQHERPIPEPVSRHRIGEEAEVVVVAWQHRADRSRIAIGIGVGERIAVDLSVSATDAADAPKCSAQDLAILADRLAAGIVR